jgi:hypothetical protein
MDLPRRASIHRLRLLRRAGLTSCPSLDPREIWKRSGKTVARTKPELIKAIHDLAEECDESGHGSLCAGLQIVIAGSRWPAPICRMSVNLGWMIVHMLDGIIAYKVLKGEK